MVSVNASGQVYLLEDEIELNNLIEQLAQTTVNGTEDRIYLRADANADYGAVMKVMGVLSKAGYAKIGLITNQEQER